MHCVVNATQGQSFSSRWQWNATVGNLIDRPGRMGDWGYVNTESAPFSCFSVAINNELPSSSPVVSGFSSTCISAKTWKWNPLWLSGQASEKRVLYCSGVYLMHRVLAR